MKKTILSDKQRVFLDLISKENYFGKFYLTGGTALCEFYIPYRFSEDLDFFSEGDFDIKSILAFLKSKKDKIGYKGLDFNTSFNRNIFQLIFEKEVLKVEFTYFPFPRIEKKRKIGNLFIDSPIDIAVNKLFTIYQKPRSRDFTDLYMMNKRYKFKMKELIAKAKIKFDWHVDPIKLGSQFLLVDELKDYPVLIKKVPEKLWRNYFLSEAKKLSKSIFDG